MKIIYFITYLFLGLCGYSQSGISSNWLLASANPSNNGYCAWLKFNNADVVTDSFFCNTNFAEISANISDTQGNILFYTNGIAIFNAQGDTMLNGKDFNPGYATAFFKNDGLRINQSCIILPLPNNPKKYYLFHETADPIGNNNYMTLRLAYSVIDMNLDNGKGAIIMKNATAINDTVGCGMLTATKHANGRDWWVAVVVPGASQMYTVLLNDKGIDGPFLQNIGNIKWGTVGDGTTTQAHFSQDGTKYAKWDIETKKLHLLDFDRCTGLFSNHLAFSPTQYDASSFYGLAFSPSGKRLYLSKWTTVEQYNLEAQDVATSGVVVATSDGFIDATNTGFGNACSLAPDSKIYIHSGLNRYLHVIDKPDSLGAACNVLQHAFPILYYNGYTLPVSPNYFLDSLIGSACDTLTSIQEQGARNEQVQVFPNPAQGCVTVQYTQVSAKSAFFTLYDAMGQIVKEKSLSSGDEIEIADLAAGVYYYQVQIGNRIYHGKIIKEE